MNKMLIFGCKNPDNPGQHAQPDHFRNRQLVACSCRQDKGIRKPTDEFFGIWAKFLADIQTAKKAGVAVSRCSDMGEFF